MESSNYLSDALLTGVKFEGFRLAGNPQVTQLATYFKLSNLYGPRYAAFPRHIHPIPV